MRVGILGPLEITSGGRRTELGGARLRVLLTVLALAGGRVVSAERLIDDLWEDDPPAGATNALQSLVSRLRSAIGRDAVESHPNGYRLNAEVDAAEFEARVGEALHGAPLPAGRRADALREALELWRGSPLPDAGGLPFAEAPAARLESLRRAAVRGRIEAELELGRHAELVPELGALSAADPLDEGVAVLLMKALYGAGRQADALEAYGTARDALAETLGVEPSQELADAHLAVLRHELPGPSARAAPTNLKTRLTSFIGRDDDLARIGELVGGHRLVTLTGPGGAGKTSLSQESARRILDRMPDGAWVVELAPVTDPAEVPQAVLTGLGLREVGLMAAVGARSVPTGESVDALGRLCMALRGKRLLLVLDNCEHLVDTAAKIADRVLAECPGVRILATSREPLAITGEALWPVEPLELPSPLAGVAEAEGSPAVRLFVERGAAVRPGFALAGGNVRDVVRICRELDGMPLALELAAARIRVLRPDQIADRLSDRFRLLTSGSRTAMPRHQTLRAVVEWSWELITEDERTLWRRLALFAGGATLESAEDVCDLPDTLGALTGLVDKSLLLVTDAGRYRMLETIREYGMERLAEAGEVGVMRRRYAEHFTAFAERAEPEMRRPDQVRWLQRLAAEHDNLHAALRCATQAGDAPTVARLCASLGWYWWMRSHRRECAEAVSAMSAMPGLPEDLTTALAYAVGGMASFGSARDFDEVRGWIDEADRIMAIAGRPVEHPLLRMMTPLVKLMSQSPGAMVLDQIAELFTADDPWLRGMARIMFGQVRINLGRIEGAEEHYRLGLAEFRATGERWGTSFALTSLAELVSWRGEHAKAVRLCEEAMRIAEEFGTQDHDPMINVRLAKQLWLVGRRDEATTLIDEAMRVADRLGDPESMAYLHYLLAEFDRLRDDPRTALMRLDRALELCLPLAGPPQFTALIISCRAIAYARLGDFAAAEACLDEAFVRAFEAEDYPVIASAAIGEAFLVWLRDGDAARTATLIGAADSIRGTRDLSSAETVALEAEVRAALGPDYAEAYGRGSGVDLDGFRLLVAGRPGTA
ncbi:BTAD domain-containing putative transcriptional regulator [Actinocorallia longicatena]|uniref:BTAD domain-containing putative transcriptional regulator n=1 Tax=Actinocorallia longicatena TaxID=111803 RepID=A0ABP6QC82_9ACTN